MKVYLRDPNAYTPLLEPTTINGKEVRSLLLGRDASQNREQIAQFSERDAQVSKKTYSIGQFMRFCANCILAQVLI